MACSENFCLNPIKFKIYNLLSCVQISTTKNVCFVVSEIAQFLSVIEQLKILKKVILRLMLLHYTKREHIQAKNKCVPV